MNNKNGVNDTNDNGNGHNVGQPETERHELQRRRCDSEFEQERQHLLQECEHLVHKIQEIEILLIAKQLLAENTASNCSSKG